VVVLSATKLLHNDELNQVDGCSNRSINDDDIQSCLNLLAPSWCPFIELSYNDWNWWSNRL